MDETIERNELKKETPAPLAEENAVEAVDSTPESTPEIVPAEAPADKPADNPEDAAEENGIDADAAAPEGEEVAQEADAEKAEEKAGEDADAPLVMPAPTDIPEAMAMPEKSAPAPVPAGPAEKLFNGLS